MDEERTGDSVFTYCYLVVIVAAVAATRMVL